MAALWATGDAQVWRAHLDAAHQRIERLNRPGLSDLDRCACVVPLQEQHACSCAVSFVHASVFAGEVATLTCEQVVLQRPAGSHL